MGTTYLGWQVRKITIEELEANLEMAIERYTEKFRKEPTVIVCNEAVIQMMPNIEGIEVRKGNVQEKVFLLGNDEEDNKHTIDLEIPEVTRRGTKRIRSQPSINSTDKRSKRNRHKNKRKDARGRSSS